MSRLNPLFAAAIIAVIGAGLYGWSVWGNGLNLLTGSNGNHTVAGGDATENASSGSVVGVVSRDPDPMQPTDMAEPEPDAEADIVDSEPARLDRPAEIREPDSAAIDAASNTQTDAAALDPATNPIDDTITVAALPDARPSEPMESQKTAQAGHAPAEVAADAECPPLDSGIGPSGDPACEATANVETPETETGTPTVAPADSANEALQSADLTPPAGKLAETTAQDDQMAAASGDDPVADAADETASVASNDQTQIDLEAAKTRNADVAAAGSASVTAEETPIEVARLDLDATVTIESDMDIRPDLPLPAPELRDNTANNPIDAVPPTFDILRVGPTGSAVIAGRAEPGSEVSVIDRDTVVGSTVADARGEWVVIPSEPLPAGASEIGLVARDAQGVEAESEQVVVLMVPNVPEQAVIADRPAEEPVAVLVARAGAGSARFLQGGVPGGGITAPEALRLESVSYDNAGDFDISGTGIPGNMIAAYLNNQPIGRAPVDTDGTWRLLPDRIIDPGLYTLRIDQVDAAGEVISRLETPFSIADLSNAQVAEGLVVVQPGNSLWRIARRIYGDGVQHTVIFNANADQIRDPDLIYPGQIFIVPGESADG